MADITKCIGTSCPKKGTCYRYTATDTPHWQAYFTEVPGEYIEEKWVCLYYWDDDESSYYSPKKSKNL